MLYRIELPSNTVTLTPLALFGEILQIELHTSSIHTNRAVVQSNCIRSTTCFPPNKASLGMVILDYRDRTDSFGWLVGYFGFNGSLRQYFSLHRAVSLRER